MHLARIFVRRQDGSKRYYWVLREATWSKKEKRPIQRYLGYLGPEPKLTLEKARKLAQKLGCAVKDLKAIKGLSIIEDGASAKKRASKR